MYKRINNIKLRRNLDGKLNLTFIIDAFQVIQLSLFPKKILLLYYS